VVTDTEDLPERAYDRTLDLNHTNPTERRGAVVTHPAQPWTSTVHAFLRHLESAGFEAAPRVVGTGFDDAGDEVLGWIEGEVFARSVWPDPAGSLYEVGAMLRRLHAAGRDFTPPPAARWMPWSLHSGDAGAVVSHGNVAPWHVVFRGLLDGYGLARAERVGLVDRIPRFAVRDNGWYARTQGFTQESRDGEGLWTLAWQSRAALWTLEHRDVLERAALA